MIHFNEFFFFFYVYIKITAVRLKQEQSFMRTHYQSINSPFSADDNRGEEKNQMRIPGKQIKKFLA